MIIGILGGTGRTGRELRACFLKQGARVISLIRNPDKFVTLHENDSYLIGNATNSNDIETLVSQVEIVIDATSVGFFHQKPTTLYSNVAQALVDARPQGKATHLIVMSSAGTHHGRHLPWPVNWSYELFLGDVANDKEKAEALLATSTLSRTIIKSPMLTQGPGKKYSVQTFDSYTPSLFDTISRKTIAQIAYDMAKKNIYIKEKIVPTENEIN